jgi:hypothetical protein
MSRVGCVTRLMTSRCQGCSDYLLCIHLYTYTIRCLNRCSTEYLGGTIQLSPMAARLRLLSSAVNARLFSSITVIPRLLSSEVNAILTWLMCYLLIYLWPLLLNEPFVVTVETSVRITIDLLLLAMQRSIVAFPWKSLSWISNM